MLPKGEHVLDAFSNPSTGLLSISKIDQPNKLFIECSTIEVSTSLQVGLLVAGSGLGQFIDAPVSGGPQGADAGTLTLMCGGSSSVFERAMPILAVMGKKEAIFHCGGSGAGLATKQLNNYLSAVAIIGLSEVMNIGNLYGLDPKILAGVINVSSGMNWNSLNHNPVKGVMAFSSASRDFEGGFSTELCSGVIDSAVALSKEVGAVTVLADTVKNTFERAKQSPLCKGKECRSIYRLFAEDGGKALR